MYMQIFWADIQVSENLKRGDGNMEWIIILMLLLLDLIEGLVIKKLRKEIARRDGAEIKPSRVGKFFKNLFRDIVGFWGIQWKP